jgi:OmpA family
MDDYYILDEVTVYFANGKVKVDPKYEAPLLQLATKAKDVEGYVIEVTGYASSTGGTEVNQKLSEDRANKCDEHPATKSKRATDADTGAGSDGRVATGQ